MCGDLRFPRSLVKTLKVVMAEGSHLRPWAWRAPPPPRPRCRSEVICVGDSEQNPEFLLFSSEREAPSLVQAALTLKSLFNISLFIFSPDRL